jgi:hypothetical protein
VTYAEFGGTESANGVANTQVALAVPAPAAGRPALAVGDYQLITLIIASSTGTVDLASLPAGWSVILDEQVAYVDSGASSGRFVLIESTTNTAAFSIPGVCSRRWEAERTYWTIPAGSSGRTAPPVFVLTAPGTNHATPAVSTAQPDSLIVGIGGSEVASPGVAWQWSSFGTFTERANNGANAGPTFGENMCVGVGELPVASPTANVSGTWTLPVTAQAAMVSIVLDGVGAAADPPTVDAGPDAQVETGEPFARTATVNDNGSPITDQGWTLTAGPADQGATFPGATLDYTATVQGAYTFEFHATNAGGTSTDTFTLTATAPAQVLTFGKTTDGTSASTSNTSRVFVSTATPAESGTVQTGHARLWLSAAGSTSVKFAIYADATGAPGALLAESDPITLNSTTEAERVFPFSGANAIEVTAGTPYWIGVGWLDPDPGGSTVGVTISRDGAAMSRLEQNITWPTLPDPYGAPVATNAGPIDAWVTYAEGGGTIGVPLGRPTSAEVARPLAVSKAVELGRPVSAEVARPLALEEPPGVGFLIDELGGAARILVEVAWGADLGADPDAWTWTDITRDVRADPGISTKLGRADEASTSQPADCTLELDNTTAAYSTGGHSPNWPHVRRNTPVRVRIDPDGAGFHDVFLGFANGFTPGWDSMTGRIPIATLSASGALRRLQQGDAPVVSAFRRAMLATESVVAYWPFEDGKNAAYAKNERGGSDMVSVSDHHEFDSSNTFDCSGPLVRLRSSPDGTFEEFGATVDPYTDTGEHQVRWLMSIPRNGLPHGAFLADIYTTGSAARWSITFSSLAASGGLNITVWDDDNNVLHETFDIGFAVNGYDLRYSLELVQDGDDVDWRIGTIAPSDLGAGYFSGTLSNHTVGRVASVFLGGNDVDDVILGHVTVQNETTSQFEAAGPLQAHVGETATAFPGGRFFRLTSDADVSFRAFGSGASISANDTMGPQLVRPLLELMRECETADQGQLWDGLIEPGLLYTTRRLRELGIVVLTIDAAAGELAGPFEPVDDDQRNRNKIEATITTGITATFEDADGPLGTATIGTYDSAVEVNNQHDEMAVHYAAWHVHLGTVQGYRYPSVTIDLRAAPHLADAALNVIPGDRIDVVNLDDTLAAFHTGTVSLIVEGIAQEITSTSWRITFQCSPFSPWGIARVAADTGDTSEFAWRLDADGAVLADDHPAGATSLTVASGADPIANDIFDRTVIDGWGQADSGQPYALVGAASAFDVSGGVGTITLTSANSFRSANLQDQAYADVDVTVTVRLGFTDVTGGLIGAAICLRRNATDSTGYQVRMFISTAEAISMDILEDSGSIAASVPTGLTHTAATSLRLRAQVHGQTVRGKVWPASDPEPDAWLVEGTSETYAAGFIGVRGLAFANNTNVPFSWSYDDLTVTTVGPPAGPPWTTDPDDYPLTLSVGGVPVTATACSGETSLQTLTVEPLPLARRAGMPVALWDPRPIGL